MDQLLHWIIGLCGISITAGHFATRAFVSLLQRRIGTQEKDSPWSEIPTWLRKTLMGVMERIFFTIAIAASLSGTAIAVVAWIALKGTLYWSGFNKTHPAKVLIAIIGSLMSLLWAIAGGFVCNGDLPKWIGRLSAG